MTTAAQSKTEGRALSGTQVGRIALGITLSITSGLMLLLAFPPYGYWPLIWIAFVPYLFAQHRLLPRRWSNLAVSLAMLFWLGPFLARLFGDEVGFFFKYMGVWIALLIFFLFKERAFHERTGYRWFILQGVANWVGFEVIRSFIPLLATNAFVGYSLYTQPWLIQPISIFSIYGLDLVIMLFNFVLAQGLMAWFDRGWELPEVVQVSWQATRGWLVGMGLVTAAWIGLSLIMFNSGPSASQTVRVAALQPNITMVAHIDKDTPEEVRFQTFVEQAREAAQQGAQMIVTPEMYFAFDPQRKHTQELRDLAAETGAYLFLSYVVSQEGEDFRNEVAYLAPTGEFLGVYGKYHAFGEPPTASRGSFPVIHTELGRLSSLICHDMNYTNVARWIAGNGAQLIAMTSGGLERASEHNVTHSVFRAVENRVATVFSSPAYVSAIVDPKGRLMGSEITPQGQRLTLVADVPLGGGGTLYTRVGDWMAWIVLAVYIGFVTFDFLTGRRARKAAQAGEPVSTQN
jgi:apolipoprotein N-acyltransferase